MSTSQVAWLKFIIYVQSSIIMGENNKIMNIFVLVSNQELDLQRHMSSSCCIFNDLRREMVFRFVDIGGFVSITFYQSTLWLSCEAKVFRHIDSWFVMLVHILSSELGTLYNPPYVNLIWISEVLPVKLPLFGKNTASLSYRVSLFWVTLLPRLKI